MSFSHIASHKKIVKNQFILKTLLAEHSRDLSYFPTKKDRSILYHFQLKQYKMNKLIINGGSSIFTHGMPKQLNMLVQSFYFMAGFQTPPFGNHIGILSSYFWHYDLNGHLECEPKIIDIFLRATLEQFKNTCGCPECNIISIFFIRCPANLRVP